jgi:tetratricopeptide (TPR) repeat protein
MESTLKIIAISIFSFVLIGCATSPSMRGDDDYDSGIEIEDGTEIDGGPKYIIHKEAEAASEAPTYMGVDGGQLSPEDSASARRKASLTLVNKGKKSVFNNEYSDAKKNLKSAISIDPQNAHAYYYLALLEYKQGQYNQALGHLQNAKVHFKDSKWKAETHVMAGRIEEDKRDWNNAAREYNIALKYTPGLVPAEKGLSRVRGRIQSFDSLPGEEEPDDDDRMPADDEDY